jgi:4-hydroxy-3-methylbut-2-en-1-yl diphosphate synthase IspG/GcpE
MPAMLRLVRHGLCCHTCYDVYTVMLLYIAFFKQYRRGWDYPLHLGVTEAGEGEDGRMKSAIGIGALLQV